MARLDISRIKARCAEDGGCLLWQGKTNEKGQPLFAEYVDGVTTTITVRRRAYEEYHGVTLTRGQQVTTCGHPRCLAKSHLSVLTVAEKVRRMHANMDAGKKLKRAKKIADHTRQVRGKLTPEQVEAIRSSDEGPYVTARRLGVNGRVASRIQNGEAYRDYGANPFDGLGAR